MIISETIFNCQSVSDLATDAPYYNFFLQKGYNRLCRIAIPVCLKRIRS